MISSAAHSLEFVSVAMKLRVYLLAQMSLSLIPTKLFGTGKPLGADCYCFMCLCGSEFWMAQSLYQQAFRTSHHLQRILIFPLSAIFSKDLENPSGHKPQQGTQLVPITTTSIC